MTLWKRGLHLLCQEDQNTRKLSIILAFSCHQLSGSPYWLEVNHTHSMNHGLLICHQNFRNSRSCSNVQVGVKHVNRIKYFSTIIAILSSSRTLHPAPGPSSLPPRLPPKFVVDQNRPYHYTEQVNWIIFPFDTIHFPPKTSSLKLLRSLYD